MIDRVKVATTLMDIASEKFASEKLSTAELAVAVHEFAEAIESLYKHLTWSYEI